MSVLKADQLLIRTEGTGLPSVIPAEFVALRRKASFVLLGSPPAGAEFDFDATHSHGYEIVGAHDSLYAERTLGSSVTLSQS